MVKLRAKIISTVGNEVPVTVVAFVPSIETDHTFAVCLTDRGQLVEKKLTELFDTQIAE